jgi:hypothetical protein
MTKLVGLLNNYFYFFMRFLLPLSWCSASATR